ncbi:MAG TPA: cytochrome c oxidase accessory protein CcoG [Aromatoleum sp.]|uniref:cytochrome c oxidase accessory protein CcoG n=1 Tax=Aromatoleum sp. TaxID=2307007 RepID=UPI002B4A330D|nr:cytochrome c oxidase accessory protein CcoG [Aromatoleum sp.]HJV26809.1 cytochrome c oxidase accessory protein CcoG [Aromatoleum sp.]
MSKPTVVTSPPSHVPPKATPETIDLYEKRRKIHFRSVKGNFNRLRWAMVLLTQALFYGLAWFDWNGRQAVLFHLTERKFYLFGVVLWPQDVIYLTALLIVSGYSLFLVTTVAGRVFCGYACPQTVYTEIFSWIERKVEGERPVRIKLDQAPWTGRKLGLRAAKYSLWALIALWTGFTFVGYFSPIRELAGNILTWTLGPWETFWMFFYAGFTLLMAGFMREQVCKYMCPYARFQSVMFDSNTMIVTYDAERGEPRGVRLRAVDEKASARGACVDCGICVQVCPTGIDIRNGLQYECIGCAACIDGCNEVMDKLHQPRGLIRYSTENAVRENWARRQMFAHVLRPRVLIYTALLCLIAGAAVWSMTHRVPLRVDVMRDRAVLAREVRGGLIENVYALQLMNIDEQPHRYRLAVAGLPGAAIADSDEVTVPATATQKLVVAVRAPEASDGVHPISFEITDADTPSVSVVEKSTFLMP